MTRLFTPQSLLERMESRTLLAFDAPLPTLDMLESPTNTVVRLETNFGDVDIELFDSTTPITVANFLTYLRAGSYDKMFFHRTVDDFVLQGGGFQFDNVSGFSSIVTNPTIQNEPVRSNVEQTLAMAKVGGNANSATSQFFFNMANNSANLDFQNGGFTVFARVIQGWDVVQSMTLPSTQIKEEDFIATGIVDINDDAKFSALTDVPVRTGHLEGTPVSESVLAFVINAEVVKPAESTQFYTEFLYYPEGFRGSTINEFLPVYNPNSFTVFYQVIARYETASRDTVIATTSIPANARGGVTISLFSDPNAALVREGAPYALEIHSTAAVAANLSHFDFGTATGEGFTGRASTKWAIGEGFKVTDQVLDFIVWQNTNDTGAVLTITFFPEGQSSVQIVRTTEAYRRGGLNLNTLTELPEGPFSTLIESNQPLVAAISHYEVGGGNGFGSLGVPGDGLNTGVIPFANVGTNVRHFLTALNSTTTAAVVNLDISFEDINEPVIETTFIITPRSRGGFDFSTLAQLADGRNFSVRYESNANIYATSVHYENGDGLGDPVSIRAAQSVHFADGFMDFNRAGTDVLQQIAVYNPFQSDANEVTVTFAYTTGVSESVTFTLQGRGRHVVNVHELQGVLDQGRQNQRFFYGISVTGSRPLVAEMRHYDITQGGGFNTLGTPFGDVIELNSPVLSGDPGSPG